jgi:hypothetical protein
MICFLYECEYCRDASSYLISQTFIRTSLIHKQHACQLVITTRSELERTLD